MTIFANKYIPLKFLCQRWRSKPFGEYPQDEYQRGLCVLSGGNAALLQRP